MKRPILTLCGIVFATSVHAQIPPPTADQSPLADPLLKPLILDSMHRMVNLAGPDCRAALTAAEADLKSSGALPDAQKIVPACRKEIGVAALVALLALAIANSRDDYHHHHRGGYGGYRSGDMPFD